MNLFRQTAILGGAVAFLLGAPHLSAASTTPSRLLNISSRAPVGTGNRVTIAGFIVEGDGKDVLVRGIGPSLRTGTGPLPGRLADPTLELFSGAGSLALNDDWKSQQKTQIEGTGIPPSSDLESAIVRSLAQGAYTAILRGKNESTGIGLIEIYDLNPTSTSRLTNLSTRGFVGTGDNVVISGFIAGGGSAELRLLVRLLGPSLKSAGLTDTLQNPTLEIVDANGVSLARNDDWQDEQFLEIERTGLAPGMLTESAIIAGFPPGNYTAIARGKDGTSGTGLLEIFQIPAASPTE